jgi:phosphodiesterase/alkaline phosphatase D-like protein
MISIFFEQGRFALALRVARSLLGGGTGLEQPREPYVQGVTASSAVICWVSQHPGSGVVEYGKTPELGRKEAEARIGRRHAVALTGLDPGSTYHYRVEGVGGSSATGASAPLPRATTHASASRWSATAAAGGRDSWQ